VRQIRQTDTRTRHTSSFNAEKRQTLVLPRREHGLGPCPPEPPYLILAAGRACQFLKP
jgi:hypothetical protein